METHQIEPDRADLKMICSYLFVYAPRNHPTRFLKSGRESFDDINDTPNHIILNQLILAPQNTWLQDLLHRHPVTLHNWHVGLNYDKLSNLSNCEFLFLACIHWFWLPCKLPSLFGPA